MVTNPAKDTVIRRRVIRNTVSNLLGKSVAMGLGFALTPFILGHLGPIHYGLWMLVGSVVTYGSMLDLGIGGAVIKYLAEFRTRGEHEEAHYFLATALRLYVFLGLLAFALSGAVALLFGSVFNIPPDERATAFALVLISGATVAISIPCVLTIAVLRGLQRFDVVNAIASIGSVCALLATVAVLLLGGGVLGLSAINIPVMLAVQAVNVIAINRVAPELHIGWRGARRRMVSRIISFSASLFVIDAASRLQTQTDEIVIGALLPISFVTPYSLARRLSEVPQMLTDQFLKVLLPLASQLHAENDLARLRSLYFASTRLTLAILIPVGGALIVLARPALTLWVGPALAENAHLVVILTLASLIVTSQWPAGSILQGMARHRFLAFTSAGAGLANLALSIALVGPLGLAGVAMGTLIPTAIECIGFVLPYTLRVLEVSTAEALRRILLPVALPTIPMMLALVLLGGMVEPYSWLSLISAGGIGVATYAVAYLIVGASPMERQTYQSWGMSVLRLLGARLRRS